MRLAAWLPRPCHWLFDRRSVQVRNQTGSNGMVAGGDAPLLGNGARMHNPATQGLLQDALANSGVPCRACLTPLSHRINLTWSCSVHSSRMCYEEPCLCLIKGPLLDLVSHTESCQSRISPLAHQSLQSTVHTHSSAHKEPPRAPTRVQQQPQARAQPRRGDKPPPT